MFVEKTYVDSVASNNIYNTNVKQGSPKCLWKRRAKRAI